MKLVAVIMAGGSGKRFWPLSRESKAKQSLTLFSSKTLLGEAIERILPICSNITVVSSIKQKEHISADVLKFDGVNVLYEPSARNTAPCIMLSIAFINSILKEECAVLVLPSDHYIADEAKFRETILSGVEFLRKNKDAVGTIGITPTYPETGFGYIRKGKKLENGIFSVKSFEEKPDAQKAAQFLQTGEYLWNAGIFLFSSFRMEKLFKQVNPDIYEGVMKIDSFEKVDADIYSSIRSISLDYAIMEKVEKGVFTLPGDFGWSDVGNWLAYFNLLPKDENGNASKGNVEFVDSTDSFTVNYTDKTFFLYNCSRQLVVATEDAVLCASLDDYQELKKVTDYILSKGYTRFL
ncbi:MAG: mannose-1-phosphate guanylyltransferase [bacterium]